MRLTCLGRYSPYPAPGGAMNGYLVQHGETALLLDAGNGVAARLQAILPVERLTAVVLSHLHEDHIADVHCLRFAQLAAQLRGRTSGKMQVYAPAEPAQQHRWLEGGETWQELHTYEPAEPLTLGDLQVRFTRTDHPFPCWAMRITPLGLEAPAIFYTGDTGASPEVTRTARGADLLLVEASLTEAYADRRALGHLTAKEAAAMARDAGVRRCLFTHLWPGLDDLQVLLTEGRKVHPAVELIEEGRTYPV